MSHILFSICLAISAIMEQHTGLYSPKNGERYSLLVFSIASTVFLFEYQEQKLLDRKGSIKLVTNAYFSKHILLL